MWMIIVIWIITVLTVFLGLFWIVLAIKYRNELRKYPEPKRHPTISVIIPAYNEHKTIKRCIESLLNLEYPKKIQIIVVNDGSTDDTEKIVKKYANKGIVKLISQKNAGKGAALNAGLKHANGELVAVMDADSLVTKDILKSLVGHFDDEKVGSVVSSIKPTKKDKLIERLQDREYIIACLFRRLLSLTNMNYITPGVFSLFRKSVLDEVGPFDEHNLTEDMEIALRLQSHGYEIRSSTLAVTKTALPDTVKKFYRQRIRWYRGLVQNTIRYKRMLFNRKYGYLGTFQLPINMIFPFIALIVMGFLFYVTATAIYQFAQYLYIVGFNPKFFFSLERLLVGFDWMIYIPWILGLFFGFLTVKISYDVMREKTGGKLNLLIFFLFYYTLINLLWCIAVIKEAIGSETKW
jgi:cellulose synthase/poly-beta-1,6-N-acetylglucosamine synthase-like glycosyltransferase